MLLWRPYSPSGYQMAITIGHFENIIRTAIDTIIFVHTINLVKVSFDPAKNYGNVLERGLWFERAQDFEFETAKLWEDD